MPAVSVTIVNHEARDLLRECLLSLEQHPYTLGPMEIVVLDNASQDGSIDMLRDEFPDVTVVEENTRRGFGANQNTVIAASSGEAVFILNPDAVVGEGTIDSLTLALLKDDRVAAVGCPTLNADGTARQKRAVRFPTPVSIYTKAIGLDRRHKDHPSSTDLFNDGWISGGAMLIDRQAFLAIDGFDESFFMYSEDVDLCKRLQADGFSFAWAPDVSVVHPLPSEFPDGVQRRQRESVRAELRYMRKHHDRIGLWVYRLGAILDSAIRVLALTVPCAARLVDTHGGSIRTTRTMHLARLRALTLSSRGEGLRESASRWNTYHAPKAPPSALEGLDEPATDEE